MMMKTSFSFVRRHSSLTLVIFGGLLASLGDAVAATQNFASVNKILVPGQAPVYDVQFRDANDANDGRSNDGEASSVFDMVVGVVNWLAWVMLHGLPKLSHNEKVAGSFPAVIRTRHCKKDLALAAIMYRNNKI